MADCKSSTIILFIALASLIFVINEKRENYAFEISGSTLKYHSNWTSSFNKLSGRKELNEALKISSLTNLDLSFAHSNFKA